MLEKITFFTFSKITSRNLGLKNSISYNKFHFNLSSFVPSYHSKYAVSKFLGLFFVFINLAALRERGNDFMPVNRLRAAP